MAHTSQPWTVGFCGFAPGFSYLVGGDPRLQVPRRAEPRTSVPAGAVGLAGSFSGIYPRSSPGGWQIIGETDAVLWDVERRPPALLQPGSRVVFVDADGPRSRSRGGRRMTAPDTAPGAAAVGRPYAELEVLATGPLALVQDLGRPGLAAVGVGRSGAADRRSFTLGARLLGQHTGLAALEVTYGGLAVRAHGSVTVVLTGAVAPASIDGTPAPHAAPFLLRDQQVLRLAAPGSGLRTYLSVRGGRRRAARARVPGHRHALRDRAAPRCGPATCCRWGSRPGSRASTWRRSRPPPRGCSS